MWVVKRLSSVCTICVGIVDVGKSWVAFKFSVLERAVRPDSRGECPHINMSKLRQRKIAAAGYRSACRRSTRAEPIQAIRFRTEALAHQETDVSSAQSCPMIERQSGSRARAWRNGIRSGLKEHLSARLETGDAELLKFGETLNGNPEPSPERHQPGRCRD